VQIDTPKKSLSPDFDNLGKYDAGLPALFCLHFIAGNYRVNYSSYFFVDFGDVVAKRFKSGNDHLVLQCFGD